MMSKSARDEVAYKPSSLGKVSFVEVVSLELSLKELNGSFIRLDKPRNPICDALERARPSFLANDEDASEIATLYRQLPPSIPDRCHNPPYGFKFHLSTSSFVSVSLCWECNNAMVWLSDLSERKFFTFDRQSKPALELFELCCRHLPLSNDLEA